MTIKVITNASDEDDGHNYDDDAGDGDDDDCDYDKDEIGYCEKQGLKLFCR